MIALQEISETIKSKGRYWIAFTGDSITSCEWVHPNWREIVEYVLQNELTDYLKNDWKTGEWGIKGFNFAYDGATTNLQHPNQLGNAYIAKVILKEVFGIEFDPELYWKDTLEGEKYPKY